MWRGLITVVSLLGLIGCHGDSPSSSSGKQRPLSDADLERLQALGYEPWVEESEAEQETGVTRAIHSAKWKPAADIIPILERQRH